MAAKRGSGHGFSRSDRVAEQIRRELADLLRFHLKDQRIAAKMGLVTVTSGEVTPDYAHAKETAGQLLERFLQRTEDGGADEIHIVYTHFVNMVTQEPRVRRILPLEVVEEEVDISEGHIGRASHEPGGDKGRPLTRAL